MADIVSLRDDPHRTVETLLPWYVGGALDADDQAMVEAHLGSCSDCQAAAAAERRLKAEVSALPASTQHGWARMRRRLDARRAPTARQAPGPAAMIRAWRTAPPWLGWALAGQAALIGAFGLIYSSAARPAYHALSAAPAPRTGTIVVIFRPETPERDLRAVLTANHARFVDGPTASDAYVLSAPIGERAAVLARLRARADVVLAEPVSVENAP